MVCLPCKDDTRGMESHDQDPTPPTGDPDPSEAPTQRAGAPDPAEAPTERGPAPDAGDAPTTEQPGGPRRLYRSRDERVIGGVCGGLAEYFGIDPLIVRIVAIALVFAGGAGFLAYLAAWLLVPSADGEPVATGLAGRTATIAGTVLLVLAVCTILPFWNGPFGGWSWGGPLLSLVVLGLAGLGLWWVASGEHPAASGTRDVLRRAGFGVAILAVCGLLAIAGAWATAAGGGAVVAVVVIVAGRGSLARPRSSAARAGSSSPRWPSRCPPASCRPPASTSTAASGTASTARLDRERGARQYKLGVGRLVRRPARRRPAAGRPPHQGRRRAPAPCRSPSHATCASPRPRRSAPARCDRSTAARGGLDVDWRDDRRALPGTTRAGHRRATSASACSRSTYDDPNDEDFSRGRSIADRPARQRGVHRRRAWLGASWTSRRSSPASRSSSSGPSCCWTALDVLDAALRGARRRWCARSSGRSCWPTGLVRRGCPPPLGTWTRRWPRAPLARARPPVAAPRPAAPDARRRLRGARARTSASTRSSCASRSSRPRRRAASASRSTCSPGCCPGRRARRGAGVGCRAGRGDDRGRRSGSGCCAQRAARLPRARACWFSRRDRLAARAGRRRAAR